VINASKMAILLASLSAGVLGFVWLKAFSTLAAGKDGVNPVITR
jgi:NhaA family Na+:H+ antiporter